MLTISDSYAIVGADLSPSSEGNTSSSGTSSKTGGAPATEE